MTVLGREDRRYWSDMANADGGGVCRPSWRVVVHHEDTLREVEHALALAQDALMHYAKGDDGRLARRVLRKIR